MKKPLLVQGGRLLAPAQGIDGTGNIIIDNGSISWLGPGETTPPESGFDILPAKGLIVCPGFIDLHCHLREPGFDEKETISTGTLASDRGGFTTICGMPNTNPPLVDVQSHQLGQGDLEDSPDLARVDLHRSGLEPPPNNDLEIVFGIAGLKVTQVAEHRNI